MLPSKYYIFSLFLVTVCSEIGVLCFLAEYSEAAFSRAVEGTMLYDSDSSCMGLLSPELFSLITEFNTSGLHLLRSGSFHLLYILIQNSLHSIGQDYISH